ncbi:MAG: dephospho-CoA kinase, partial [Bacteroidetes bacterium]|nr:dephospho-CoA kinase [Bacteroidota bacterium]
AYNEKGLDRAYMGARVFNDKAKLDQLNALVHPVTIADSEAWMEKQTTPYAIKEAALVFEAGTQKYMDYVIGVSAPLSLRILRSMRRDGATKEKVESVINRQLDESIKMKLCDFVIVNDEQQALIPQVMKLHEIFVRRES